MRWWLLVLAWGCTGPEDTGGDTDVTPLEACDLAAENTECPECDDGPVTCTYGEHSETENSCGDCQARSALYQALCDAGVEDSSAQIEEDTVCESAEEIPASPACTLADQYATCLQCDDGLITCTFEEFSASETSCGDCQPLGALYADMCAMGVSDTLETLLAGTECTDPVIIEG